MALYAYRVAEEARQSASALTAAELVLARAQHLSQIDGLAAAAAHELGTPLATVALVVREMAAHPSPDEEFADDLRLLEQSVDRCRSILGKLSSPAEALRRGSWIFPVRSSSRKSRPRPIGCSESRSRSRARAPIPPPQCARNPGVLYGLGNLIENAVSFAEKTVIIRARWTQIDGQDPYRRRRTGLSAEPPGRIGEPYLSQRDERAATKEAGGGLGLGLFIARSLLERSGATLKFANAAPPATGAVVTVEWPRAGLRAGSTTRTISR